MVNEHRSPSARSKSRGSGTAVTSIMSDMTDTVTAQRRNSSIAAAPHTVGKNKKQQNMSVTDATLHPSRGSLMCRLATNCQHMPVKSKSKRPRCQLHRWARGRDGTAVMNQIIACSVCCVDLCVECFNIFHKEANLGDWKESIGAISDREKNVGR